MYCAISGEVPTKPVVSKLSGHLFEKHLIEKHLEASDGLCPVTGQPLSADELMPLQCNLGVRPRPPSATSLPGLLALFQNEWDSLMLETHTLKKHLDDTRKELSQALYQHDAACRVIARLMRERDEARAMLSSHQSNVATHAAAVAAGASEGSGAAAGGAMDVDGGAGADGPPPGISDEAIGEMSAKWKQLSKERKKRPAPPTLADAAAVGALAVKKSHSLHKSSKPGVLSLDLSPHEPNVVLSAGVDHEAMLFDTESGKIVSTLAGHGKKVTCARFHPSDSSLVVSSSADKTAKIWRPNADTDKWACAATLSDHADDVVGVSVHATGSYIATASKDKTWCFYDLGLGGGGGGRPRCLVQVGGDATMSGGFECVEFHPDGLILGTGTSDSLIRIWDMKTQANVHSFEGHSGAVHDISFSENGYYLASGGADGTVKLWDLRKLKNFKTIEPPSSGKKTAPIQAVAFDYSGTYLAYASDKICIDVVKEWNTIATLEGHSKAVTSLKFGPDASVLLSASMDRSIKIWS